MSDEPIVLTGAEWPPEWLTGKIFEGDPNRPGAGYIMFNGHPYRIMGTTSAGLNNPQDLEGSSYVLDGGLDEAGNSISVAGPLVDVQDYLTWIGEWHAPDVAPVVAPAYVLSPSQVPNNAGKLQALQWLMDRLSKGQEVTKADALAAINKAF